MTASGAITVRTADGKSVGHGWGQVLVRRDPDTGGTSSTGEIREMIWSEEMPEAPPRQTYRVDFYGGPTFLGVFEAAFPDTSQRRATFRPFGVS